MALNIIHATSGRNFSKTGFNGMQQCASATLAGKPKPKAGQEHLSNAYSRGLPDDKRPKGVANTSLSRSYLKPGCKHG